MGIGGFGPFDTPQPFPGITNAASISGACAVLTTGGVDCWWPDADGEGSNGYGSVQAVTGITNATSVANEDSADCAVLATGGVDCWGYNDDGELGNGTYGGPDFDGYYTPQPVTGITEAYSVVGGDGTACAALDTGGVDCLGYNADGEVGNGTIGGPGGEDGYDTPQSVLAP